MQIIKTEPKTNNISLETWTHLYKRLGEIANPQLSALKRLLEAPFKIEFSPEEAQQQKAYDQYMSVLRLKLEGLKKEPSPIEKTMTRAQLFLSGSPLWTINLRPDAIKIILEVHRKLENSQLQKLIEPIINNAIDNDYGTINNQKLHEILNKKLSTGK